MKVSSALTGIESAGGDSLGLVMGIHVDVSLCFGRRELSLGEILRLAPGAIVVLDQGIDDPVDLLVGGQLVGRGDVVTDGGKYALRLKEVIDPHQKEPTWSK